MEKHNVDLDSYDHTYISIRPDVLINRYSKNRTPFLTLIHLWNKQSSYMLSSRHDPLKIRLGEGGMSNGNDGGTNSSSGFIAKRPRS